MAVAPIEGVPACELLQHHQSGREVQAWHIFGGGSLCVNDQLPAFPEGRFSDQKSIVSNEVQKVVRRVLTIVIVNRFQFMYGIVSVGSEVRLE